MQMGFVRRIDININTESLCKYLLDNGDPGEEGPPTVP